MSLSKEAKARLVIALTDEHIGKEVAAAIDASGSGPAADVVAQSNASAVTVTLSTSDTYTDAAVRAAVNAALVSVIADINADRAKISEILTKLKAAGLMA